MAVRAISPQETIHATIAEDVRNVHVFILNEPIRQITIATMVAASVPKALEQVSSRVVASASIVLAIITAAKTASRVATSLVSRVATSLVSRVATSLASRVVISLASRVATSLANRVVISLASKVVTNLANRVATSLANRVATSLASRVVTSLANRVAISPISRAAIARRVVIASKVAISKVIASTARVMIPVPNTI